MKIARLAALCSISVTAACDSTPSFDMTGVYRNTSTNLRGSAVSRLEFTGPGYCRVIIGDAPKIRIDGKCEQKNGGIEFSGGPEVLFWKIEGSALVQNSGPGSTDTFVKR